MKVTVTISHLLPLEGMVWIQLGWFVGTAPQIPPKEDPRDIFVNFTVLDPAYHIALKLLASYHSWSIVSSSSSQVPLS